MGLIQKHKTLIQCPKCDSNLTTLYAPEKDTAVLKRIANVGTCRVCMKFYKITLEEIK